MRVSFYNLIWLYSMYPKRIYFLRSLKDPYNTQKKILFSLLRSNRNTVYGQKYSFNSIKTIKDFQSTVPIVSYEDIQHYVDDISNGRPKVLSSQKILFFEETSGAGINSKLIPYNRSLLSQFNFALSSWIWSIYSQYPSIFKGRSYWSISPPMKSQWETKANIQVGIKNDFEYLSLFGRYISKNIMIHLDCDLYEDSETFYIETLKKIYSERHIGLISIWSPTFIFQLDNILRKNWNQIIPYNSQIDNKSTWSDIFPSIKLVSCWTHGNSAQFMDKLKDILGDINIEPKGLLSTEGVVSIPFIKGIDPVLAITSHFFEFQCQKSKEISLSHELNKDYTYEVILSSGNGILRYRTGDLIKVTGYIRSTPTMVFIGKKSRISDIVGEKLSETHCVELINKITSVFKNNGLFISPFKNVENKYYYALYISGDNFNTNDLISIKNLAVSVLNKNPYFKQAVSIGQLDDFRIVNIDDITFNNIIDNYFIKYKVKHGDRKPPALFLVNELDLIKD